MEVRGGGGIFIYNTYSLHPHHQNDSALRWAAVWQETLGFTSTETINCLMLIRDWEVGGSGFLYLTPTRYTYCHHQNDSALRWAVVWAILKFHWLCGQSHKTVSINHNFFLSSDEKREPKRIEPKSFCLTDGARPFILSQTLWNVRNSPSAHWQAVPNWREGVGKTQGPELKLAYTATPLQNGCCTAVHDKV